MQKRSIAFIIGASAIALMAATTPAALQTFAQGSSPATPAATAASPLIATSAPTVAATTSPVSNAKFNGLLAGASYFMPNAPIYASIRVDQNFVGTADALLTHVEQELPPDMLPAASRISLAQSLDSYSQLLVQQKLSDVQGWLGGTVAFGINTVNTLMQNGFLDGTPAMPSYALVAPITDQVAAGNAVAALVAQAPTGQWTKRSDSIGIVYINNANAFSPGEQQEILIGKDVLAFGTVPGISDLACLKTLPPTNPASATLADQPLFQQTVALLPAPGYNALAYIDTPAILAQLSGFALRSGYNHDQDLSNLINGLITAHVVGPQVWGATLLNNDTLTLDVAQAAGNTAALAAAGIIMSDTTPVDPTFAKLLPTGTIAYVQVANVKGSYDNAIANLGALWDLLPVSLLAPINQDLYAVIDAQPPTTPESGKASVQRLLRTADVLITGATGLTTKEASALFSGNLIIGLVNNPQYRPINVDRNTIPVDVVGISEITGTIDAPTIANTLARQLQLTFDTLAPTVSTHIETISGAPTLVIGVPAQNGLPGLSPVSEILIGFSTKAVVFGSRGAVTATLRGMASNTTPAQNPALVPLLVNNTGVVGYWNPAATSDLITRFGGRDPQSVHGLNALIGLFSSGTISAVSTNGTTIERFTLSLK